MLLTSLDFQIVWAKLKICLKKPSHLWSNSSTKNFLSCSILFSPAWQQQHDWDAECGRRRWARVSAAHSGGAHWSRIGAWDLGHLQRGLCGLGSAQPNFADLPAPLRHSGQSCLRQCREHLLPSPSSKWVLRDIEFTFCVGEKSFWEVCRFITQLLKIIPNNYSTD